MSSPLAPDLAHLLSLYKQLKEADAAYAEQPTIANHASILRAQRVYYAALLRYNRDHYPPHEARYYNARALHDRASTNRKRLPDDTDWQALAHHQAQRAHRLRMRVAAYNHSQPPPPKPTPQRTTPKPTKPKRTRHPITGRLVYTSD